MPHKTRVSYKCKPCDNPKKRHVCAASVKTATHTTADDKEASDEDGEEEDEDLPSLSENTHQKQ